MAREILNGLTAAILVALMSAPSMVNAEDEWDFTWAPYIWITALEGDVSTFPNAPVVPVDVGTSSLSDALGAVSILLEARKQRHGVVAEILYWKLESDTELIPAIDLTMKSTSRNSMFSAAYRYALSEKEGSVIDAFAGVRYWKVDTELQFGGGLGMLAGQRISNDESWYDPVIGVKGRTRLGDSKFYATGWLAAGGFGVGSDEIYDASVNVGYQWNKSLGTTLGYRVIDVEYKEGSYLYDVKQTGWGLGFSKSY